jgi:DnaJ-class molecular chaperone
MAARDPYEVLGVSKKASAADIKRAFRSLAKKFHPDAHGNDPKKAKRFQEISAANEVIGDKEKRAQYDRGEIDGSGQPRGFDPRAQGFGGFQSGGFEGGPGGFDFRTAKSGSFRAEDIFSDILGGLGGGAGRSRPRRPRPAKGEDVRLAATITLEEAVGGGTRRLKIRGGKQLEVRIPVAVKDGQQIRLRGKGGKGLNGGPAGDVLITINLAPHPLFTRDGQNLRLELAISLKEAIFGGNVEVPTLSGPVSLTIPSHSNSGRVLRLKVKGLPRGDEKTLGDLYVRLSVTLPDTPDAKLDDFVRTWESTHNPRRKDK